jgi:predicted PurR-regulated permease PerM
MGNSDYPDHTVLIPVIGSCIGGAAVTLLALTVSLPVALATLAFYICYKLAEDHLLVPRVMNRTVHVPPTATLVAVLMGESCSESSARWSRSRSPRRSACC